MKARGITSVRPLSATTDAPRKGGGRLQARSSVPALALAVTLLAIPLYASSQMVEGNVDHSGGILRPRSGRPTFEVAVIRPSAPGAEYRFNGIGVRPGRFEAQGTTLRDLITFADAVPDEKELLGGPSWVGTERFEIRAKIEDADLSAVTALPFSKQKDEMRVRLQVLLEQRFHLQLTFTTKPLPLLALEMVRGGSKCKQVIESNVIAFERLPPPPPPQDSRPIAGTPTEVEREMVHWSSDGLPFPLVLSWISQQAEVRGRTVVDQTGLSGGFECELSWIRNKADPADSTFFTAIREQMGFRLQPERRALEVLQVQNVEHPTAN